MDTVVPYRDFPGINSPTTGQCAFLGQLNPLFMVAVHQHSLGSTKYLLAATSRLLQQKYQPKVNCNRLWNRLRYILAQDEIND